MDVQAQAILLGLNALLTLLAKPIARDALDLEKNARTAEQYNILQRLQRSLTQYLQREGELFYVGLLGHFSSGKSSTINSILAIWNTPEERATDLNPTDKTITLITRDTNEKRLLGVIKEGSITIRSQSVEHSLLDHVVLADTPGTGDPQLLEEIARDFLPICDVILFFFSATSPLDQTDMPILSELHRRLPFIPIRFVVTRADELRDDYSRPVSSGNINKTKRSKFFGEMIDRINKLLHPIVYTEQDFILVDNKAPYNIESVVELIVAKCNPANPQAKILMHGHKLQYFRTMSRELRSFFERFLDDKLRELGKIVSTADQNIRLYNENVVISNASLTKNWIDQLSAVQASREAVTSRLDPAEVLPSNVDAFDVVVARRADTNKLLSEQAMQDAQYIHSRFKMELSDRIRQRVDDLELWRFDAFSNRDSIVAKSTTLSSVRMDQDSLVPMIPTMLASYWASLRETKAAALRDAAARLRKVFDETGELLEQRRPLEQCEAEVHKGQRSLASDLTQFFRNAELYRSGVFSHATKESISTLGIGAKLDALEAEFEESDKTLFLNEATSNLFPSSTDLVARALTRVANLQKALRPLIGIAKDLKIPSPDVSQLSIIPTIDSERKAARDAVAAELHDEILKLVSRLEVRLSAVLVEHARRYDDDLRLARKKRYWRYASIIVGVGGLSFGAYLLVMFNRDVSQDILNSIGWNLAASGISGFVGFLAARALDNFPRTESQVREEAQKLLRRDIARVVDEDLQATQFVSIDTSRLLERLKNSFRLVVDTDPDGWQSVAAERLNSLRELRSEYEKVRREYLDGIEELVSGISAYFSDAEKNLKTLNRVADRIKERAIQPSFTLLDETRASLDQVRREVGAIDFS